MNSANIWLIIDETLAALMLLEALIVESTPKSQHVGTKVP